MAQREGSVETGYGWVIVFCSLAIHNHRPRFADRPFGRAQADCCRIRLAALGSLPCLFDDDDRHRRRRHP